MGRNAQETAKNFQDWVQSLPEVQVTSESGSVRTGRLHTRYENYSSILWPHGGITGVSNRLISFK